MELLYGVFVFSCFIAAVWDFLVYKIPNEIFLFIIVLFVLKMLLLQPLKDLIMPFVSFSAVLIVGFFLYWMKWLGAGDAKFIATASLWLSQTNLFLFLIIMSLAGGVLAVIYLKFEPFISAVHQKIAIQLQKFPLLKDLDIVKDIALTKTTRVDPTTKKEAPIIPYGVAVFIGASLTYLIEK